MDVRVIAKIKVVESSLFQLFFLVATDLLNKNMRYRHASLSPAREILGVQIQQHPRLGGPGSASQKAVCSALFPIAGPQSPWRVS